MSEVGLCRAGNAVQLSRINSGIGLRSIRTLHKLADVAGSRALIDTSRPEELQTTLRACDKDLAAQCITHLVKYILLRIPALRYHAEGLFLGQVEYTCCQWLPLCQRHPAV